MAFLDYFQLAALLFFLAVFLGRTLYLRFVRGVRPLTLGVGKKGFNRVLELFFFFGLYFWIAEVFLYSIPTGIRLGPPALEVIILDSTIAQTIGVVMVIAGLMLFVWALRSFGDSWRMGIDNRAPGKLVTTGAFAFSRNPIFLFIDVYFTGTFLINGTIILLLLSIVVIIGIHYQIIQEEKHLRSYYGQPYKDYCANTGRYITLKSMAA